MGKKTILIIDDEPEVLQAVATLVRHEGYDVMLAESGEKTLGILTRRSFDLILTDLMMPGNTGWQVLEAAKQQYPDIKVVVFTGYIDDQGEAMLVDRNTDGFLVKPIDVAKMRSLLASLLGDEELIGGRIVAVDDERVTLTMVEDVLSDSGMSVTSFESAQEALSGANLDPPDLFVIDVEMPNMNGFEMCEVLRNNNGLARIPIIILTGHADRKTVLRALELGVQGFVIKPYDAENLVAKVRKTLARSKKKTA